MKRDIGTASANGGWLQRLVRCVWLMAAQSSIPKLLNFAGSTACQILRLRANKYPACNPYHFGLIVIHNPVRKSNIWIDSNLCQDKSMKISAIPERMVVKICRCR